MSVTGVQAISRAMQTSPPPTETPYTLMNYFLRCSVFVSWCFHSEEKDVVLEAVLECTVPPSWEVVGGPLEAKRDRPSGQLTGLRGVKKGCGKDTWCFFLTTS